MWKKVTGGFGFIVNFLQEFGREAQKKEVHNHEHRGYYYQEARVKPDMGNSGGSVRLRTNVAKKYRRVTNAARVIWQTLMIADRKFRRLNASELLRDVYEEARYANGIRVKEEPIKADAA